MHAHLHRLGPLVAVVAVLASGCGLTSADEPPATSPEASSTDSGTAAPTTSEPPSARPTSVESTRTTAAAQSTTDVINVHPLPGAVVDTAGVELGAVVVGDQSPSDVTVTVDGDPVDASAQPQGNGTAVTAPLGELDTGPRALTVSATFDDHTATRTWSVTASERSLQRLAGGDRFATAVAVSQDLYPDRGSAPAAVVARSDDFADALAGGPLASHLGGPLLLTGTDALPEATAEELSRVLADDAPVHLLGGTVAISDDVEDQIVASGHEVVRHAGGDRYATAAEVAAALPDSDTVIVAAGTRFPDALAASVPAARDGWPVLLTATDRLPEATADALTARGATSAVVVGGEVAVDGDVANEIDEIVGEVERVSGPDRYATAVAVADRFFDQPREVAIASGRDYPDALGAATRASGADAPLLLAEPLALPDATDTALRRLRPGSLVVHGGPVAIADDVADAARHAVVDGPDAPRVVATVPASGESSPTIAPIEVLLDRALDADSLVAAVTLDGSELPTQVRPGSDSSRVIVDPLSPGDLPLDEAREVRVVLRAADAAGQVLHHAHTFVLQDSGGVFASAIGLDLVEPSTATEFVGYHQSNHEGAREMAPAEDGPPWTTLESRGRRSSARSAADVVADEHVEVVAPVTGAVLRAGSYELYCGIYDHYIAIEPDGMAGIEVKMLHFRGLRVGAGDRVEAGETVIGDGPRRLPFDSQVDEHSSSGYGPHVHIEVVDTSIPNISNPGSGSDDC